MAAPRATTLPLSARAPIRLRRSTRPRQRSRRAVGVCKADNTPAALTVTPDAGQSKVFGVELPILTYAAGGFVNGDPAAVLVGLLGTTATAASPVGQYPF